MIKIKIFKLIPVLSVALALILFANGVGYADSPVFISLNPNISTSSVGTPQTLSLAINDEDGYPDIQIIRLVVKDPEATDEDSVILEYWSMYNKVVMYNYNEGRFRGGIPGSDLIIADDFCEFNISQTTVTGNGNVLTINWHITPKNTFVGEKIIWLNVFDYGGNRLRIPEAGLWTITLGQSYELTMGVSPSAGGTTFPSVGNHFFQENEAVTIVANANPGYRFVRWSGDVNDIFSQSTVVSMNESKTATANFEVVPGYTLSIGVNPVGGGATAPAAGDHQYGEGEVVFITATPNAGYRFVSWEGEVADPNASSTTVTMNAAKEITAYFEAAEAGNTFSVDFNYANVGDRTYTRIGAALPFEITRNDFIAAGFNTLSGSLFKVTISHMHNGDKPDNPETWVLSFDDGSGVAIPIFVLGYSALEFIDEEVPETLDLSGTNWKFIINEISNDGPYDSDRLFLDKLTISSAANLGT